MKNPQNSKNTKKISQRVSKTIFFKILGWTLGSKVENKRPRALQEGFKVANGATVCTSWVGLAECAGPGGGYRRGLRIINSGIFETRTRGTMTRKQKFLRFR